MGLNINLFLAIISAILFSIFIFIKPFEVLKSEKKEVPILELNDFIIFELDTEGLNTKLLGSHAFKFTNRYEIDNVDYTDAKNELSDNLTAKHGRYQDDIIDLEGDVHYKRIDGVRFDSQEAQYKNKLGIVSTQKDFILYQNESWFSGTKLLFDTKKESYSALSVEGLYYLEKEEI